MATRQLRTTVACSHTYGFQPWGGYGLRVAPWRTVRALARLVEQKESHAKTVKEEVRIIWGDYFKAPQFEQVPNAHELVHNIMMQGSKCKQNVQVEHGDALLALVNDFAKAFWLTKGVETFEADCPYPPSRKVVYPKLG